MTTQFMTHTKHSIGVHMYQFPTLVLTSVLTAGAAGNFLHADREHSCPNTCKDHATALATSVSADTTVKRHTISVALSGYSPVSYLDQNRAEPGSPLYTAEHDGATYFLTSQSQVRAFKKNPEKYLPAYGGFCAFGCSVDSEFIPDPTSFKVIDGRTHLFLKNDEVNAKQLWNEASPLEVKSKADAYWKNVNGG